MSMYPQPTAYECGPFALKHALLTLGVFTDERLLGRVAGTTTQGTDERQLARAAERFGAELPVVRFGEPEPARAALVAALARGHPTLLCVDQWDHWLTVAGERDGQFTLLDSAESDVVRVIEWPVLARRWGYQHRRADGRTAFVYDLHPLVPNTSPRARGSLAPERAGFLTNGGRPIAREWSEHAEALIQLTASFAGATQPVDFVSLSVLLDRWREALFRLAGVVDGEEREAAGRVIKGLQFVADFYRLALPPQATREAVGFLAEMLRQRVA